jgi:hypothetical protein
VHFDRGNFLLRRGADPRPALQEAIDKYNAALQLNPKLASAFYGRGLARLKTGDQVGGDADIAAAKVLAADIGDEFARHGVR